MSDLAERLSRIPKEERAKLLARLRESAELRAPEPQLVRRSHGQWAPASFQQEQLWFVDRLSAGRARNNVALTLRIRGPLDLSVLRAALDELVARHEVLRTTFAEVDGSVRAVIAPQMRLELPVVDLSSLPTDQREERLRALASERASEGFDLERGPVWRTVLARLTAEEHVLVWVIHHIGWDPWSGRLFVSELVDLYEAYAAGEPSPLPEVPVQYADFAAWQRDRVAGPEAERLREFWRRQLNGVEGLEVPPDFPRTRERRYLGARIVREVGSEVLAGLTAIGQQEGATLFMTLLAAFNALLVRYTRHTDIVVGTASVVRRRPELQQLLGCFVNMHVLRTDSSGDPTFRELVRRTRKSALEAFSHDELPFEQVVEAVNPPRDASTNPLFQIEFTVFAADEGGGPATRMLDIEVGAVHGSMSRFDLSVLAWVEADRLKLSIEYDRDLYLPETAARLLGTFALLLNDVVRDPESRVSRLRVFDDADLRRAGRRWARGRRVAVPERTLDEALAVRAAVMPDAIAVVGAGGSIRCGELNARANRLAHRLVGLGVGPETRVGVCVDRSPEAVAAVLAVLKAGAAYVPLDPAYPDERARRILDDAAARVVVASERYASRLSGGERRVLCLEQESAACAALPETDPEPRARPANLAYVMYTSGSTGTPKGVMIEHRSVVAFVEAIAEAYGISSDDRLLQFASLAFDVSVFDIFTALLTGAQLVVATEEERNDPTRLTELMRAERVTVAELPPALLPLLSPDELPDLRLVSVGGERFPGGLVEAWATSTRRFVNGYGPTETTVAVTLMECEGRWDSPPPIGRPMRNHEALVLDERLELVPVGVPGELCVAGIGLARGYLGRPALTAERFVPHPFAADPGARLYRTGDLVRWRPDGTLEFLGRVDRQVKIRGFRVELGDVETVLAGHPLVRRAVAETVDDERGHRLVAYVEPSDGEAPSAAELRDFLAARLPAYMMPARFVAVARIPLTANGKVDRRALPPPGDDRPDEEQELVAPRTPTEQRIAEEIFSTMLGVARVGVEDNFFELGGSSLQAMQVVSRVRVVFGVEVRLADFFESPTVAHLAELVERNAGHESEERARLFETLERIEQLSDDETRELLSALGGG